MIANTKTDCLQCSPCEYSFNGTSCISCPRMAENCDSTCVDLTSYSKLKIESGNWVKFDSTNQSIQLQDCQACLSLECTSVCEHECLINCSQVQNCKQGYVSGSRLCSQCESDYFENGQDCTLCPNSKWVIPFIISGLLLLVILLAFHQVLLGFIVEVFLSVGSYLINFTPLWLVTVIFLLLLISTINILSQYRHQKRHPNENHHHENSPLSHGLLKSFLFYSQFVSYLLGTNAISLLLSSGKWKPV